MERYSAFNAAGGRRRFFRVWHSPWLQAPVAVVIEDLALLEKQRCRQFMFEYGIALAANHHMPFFE